MHAQREESLNLQTTLALLLEQRDSTARVIRAQNANLRKRMADHVQRERDLKMLLGNQRRIVVDLRAKLRNDMADQQVSRELRRSANDIALTMRRLSEEKLKAQSDLVDLQDMVNELRDEADVMRAQLDEAEAKQQSMQAQLEVLTLSSATASQRVEQANAKANWAEAKAKAFKKDCELEVDTRIRTTDIARRLTFVFKEIVDEITTLTTGEEDDDIDMDDLDSVLVSANRLLCPLFQSLEAVFVLDCEDENVPPTVVDTIPLGRVETQDMVKRTDKTFRAIRRRQRARRVAQRAMQQPEDPEDFEDDGDSDLEEYEDDGYDYEEDEHDGDEDGYDDDELD
jgi:chromosome segregation ATPase